MASGTYQLWKSGLLSKAYNMNGGDTLYVALVNSTYTFNTAHTTWTSTAANVSSTEITVATGYTAGGLALTSVVTGATTGTAYFGAANSSWASFTGNSYGAVIYDSTVSSNLVAYIDFGGVQTVTAGTLTLSWNAGGIVTLS